MEEKRNAMLREYVPPEAREQIMNAMLAQGGPPLAGPGEYPYGLPEFVRAYRRAAANVIEPIDHALQYPARVKARMQGDRSDSMMPPNVLANLRYIQGIDDLGQYEPGPRESRNVEDRRPTSPWSW